MTISMVARFKWTHLAFFSILSLFGAWYVRKAALSVAKLFYKKSNSNNMAAEVIDLHNIGTLRSHPKENICNAFEMLFNDKKDSNIHFHVKHPDIVKRKLANIIAFGPDNLQVISDFDWCMSKFMHEGKLNPTCHGIFELDPEMTHETQNKLRMLRQTYSAVEVDPHIPIETKIPYMKEWWDLSHKVIANSNMHRGSLTTTVNECNLALRDRVIDFMTVLHKHNIPMLIFSAGLGNVIELLLERYEVGYDNVRVVSNFMDFNDEGLLIGFREPIIHTFNKTVASINNSDYGQKILLKRQNVILLGDSTADPNMVHGLIDESVTKLETDKEGLHPSNVLRIGFLNTKVGSLLDTYENLYDIVLSGDATFDLPLEILYCILHPDSLNL